MKLLLADGGFPSTSILTKETKLVTEVHTPKSGFVSEGGLKTLTWEDDGS